MDTSNHGTSVYHRLGAMVLFDALGTLLCATGPLEEWITARWRSCVPFLLRQDRALSPTATFVGSLRDGSRSVTIYRGQQLPDGNSTGLILETAGSENEFDSFFVRLILNQSTFAVKRPTATTLTVAEDREAAAAAADVTTLFDSYLRYQGKDDQWTAGGSDYFLSCAKRFTAKCAKIELCLPAFPCKSSNLNKVTGKNPDHGEWLALERLHGFVEAVEKVYAPGALVWIISDGHVFSDCIGVDDADVDRYGQQLAEMNHSIGTALGRLDRVQFRSLVDLFSLHQSELSVPQTGSYSAMADRLCIPALEHHVPTSVTEEAELCRRILMAGCQPQRSGVRSLIKSRDAAVLALYRGFSRFMLEDLELHPFMKKMSRSKQKKVSCEVAFEMILRNQAYSNLVEMLFPHHLRLSIHAHNNAGPKFGIQLFDPASVRVAASLAPDSAVMTAVDLLHIPTPWHNCVVKFGDRLIVTKSRTARNAVVSGSFEGGLVQGRPGERGGACFELRDPASSTAAACPDNAQDNKVQVEVKTPAVKVVETEIPTRPMDGSNSDGTSGQLTKPGPLNSGWLVWLRRLTAWWLWSRSSAYALSNNPYHEHKSQSLGA